VGCRDVPLRTRDVNLRTAEAPCAAYLGLGRKLAARRPHCLLPCRPGARAAMVGQVSVGVIWPKLTPGGVELRSRISEVRRRALGADLRCDPEGMPQRQPHCSASVGTPARRPMVPIWTSSRKISQVSSLREVIAAAGQFAHGIASGSCRRRFVSCRSSAGGRLPALRHFSQRSRLARSCTQVVGTCGSEARSTVRGVRQREQAISSQG
jgi:hypothetical protein